jgi:hypothetical protein|tara:strand:+ start:2465 stop:3100 length:636 start_codon:yes stop_codon:yes gene_type:complete
MSGNNEQIGTLEELFKAELKEPFHYKLSLTDVRNETKEIFDSMRKMYTMGLVIHYGNQEKQSVDIQSLTSEKIDKINKYMLSIGIKATYKVYKPSDIDYLYRRFLNVIDSYKDLHIDIISDWKTQLIKTIRLNVVNNNKEILGKVIKELDDHHEANFFLKMKPPDRLKEYAILVTTKENTTHIINFDFANIGDYCKPYCAAQHREKFRYRD